jgi:hypothetical protein
MSFGVIYTPDRTRDLVHRDNVVTEARPIPHDGWDEWVEVRKGHIDYSTGMITWKDGSREFVQPLFA